jgi:hypothetical protein
MYIVEDQLRSDTQIIDTQSLSDSVIAINKSIITRFPFPIYNKYNQNWHTGMFFSHIIYGKDIRKIQIIYIKSILSKFKIISFLQILKCQDIIGLHLSSYQSDLFLFSEWLFC